MAVDMYTSRSTTCPLASFRFVSYAGTSQEHEAPAELAYVIGVAGRSYYPSSTSVGPVGMMKGGGDCPGGLSLGGTVLGG